MGGFCFFLGARIDVVIFHFGNGKRFCLPTSIKMNSAYLRAQRGCHKLISDVSLIPLQARLLKQRLWNLIPLSQERLKSTYSEQVSVCLCLTRCPLVFPWIIAGLGPWSYWLQVDWKMHQNHTKKFQRGWRIDSSLIISISMNGKAVRETTLCFPFPNLESKGQMFAVMWVEKLVW